MWLQDGGTWPGVRYTGKAVQNYLEDDRFRLKSQLVQLTHGEVLIIARREGWWSLTQYRDLSLHTGAKNGTIGLPVFTTRLDAYDQAGDLAAAVDHILRAPEEDRAAAGGLEGPFAGGTPTLAKHLSPGDELEFWADGGMTSGTVIEACGNGHGGINLTLRTTDGADHRRIWHRLEEVSAPGTDDRA